MLDNPNYMLIGSNVRHTDMDGKEVFIERVPLSTEEIKRRCILIVVSHTHLLCLEQ